MSLENIKVHKAQLENGLTILTLPMRHIPKVSIQLWYNVGSRHESQGEKGLAHLIEHMIFKGTNLLSEIDLTAATTKLSGSCNAFTSHDYTGYIFEFPTQHWTYAFELLANCMRNCTFKPDLLNSELKTVVQELKMYRDNYEMSLLDEMMSDIFRGHPYHHPIVGYKTDLCFVNADNLRNFYSCHYLPNNATLVVVGDVDPDDVQQQAEKYFGNIQSAPIENREPYLFWERDFIAKTVTLYRDIQASTLMCAFVIPGAKERQDYVTDIFSLILASGRGSRLHKKLVEELGIATSVACFSYDLFDFGLFIVQVQPKALHTITEIVKLIRDEIMALGQSGVTLAELERAQAKEKVHYLSLFENNEKLAYEIGKSYLATYDEDYVLNRLTDKHKNIASELKLFIDQWLHPDLMHIGYVLPLAEKDKQSWQKFQAQSDVNDQLLLKGKERISELEGLHFANTVVIGDPHDFKFPCYKSFILSNGLEILYYADQRIPKVECTIELKANFLYDLADQQGLNNFMSQLLLKGTSKYSATQLADIFESKGIGIGVSSGVIAMNCLSNDLLFALEMVSHILTDSIFSPDAIVQVHNKIEVDLAEYWDQPYQFISDLIRKKIYNKHQYSNNILGTKESIKNISREDILSCYQKYMTPHGARLAIVGDFDENKLQDTLEKTLGVWHGPKVADLIYPELAPIIHEDIIYKINRDQVVFAFAGLSVKRKDPDYDKLLLFDQKFGSGVLGSMDTMLFEIREATGLFYTINGSVIAGVDKQPGLALVKTIVSLDRLAEAECAIKCVIEAAAEKITEEDLMQSRRAITNTMVDYFTSYRQMAMTFLSLRRFDLPVDYFDNRVQQLNAVDLQSVKKAAKQVLDTHKMLTIKVGRV